MNRTLAAILLAALLTMQPYAADAATIYSDNFDGAAGTDLHGTTPDVGANNWGAHTSFDADGTVVNVAGGTGAWLPLTPAAGQIYTLSASFRGVTGNANWFALGYAETFPANPQNTGNDYRFISGATVGKAWMLFRGTNAVNPNQTLRGDAGSGTFAAGTLSWMGGPVEGGDVDLRIVLNTLAGAGNYTATFFAKRPTDAAYTDVGGGALDLNAEDIGAVGIVYSNTGVTATVTNFELTAVPEPASLWMLGIAASGLTVVATRRARK